MHYGSEIGWAAGFTGRLEPHRAGQFGSEFLPPARTRSSRVRVWLAEQRGAAVTRRDSYGHGRTHGALAVTALGA